MVNVYLTANNINIDWGDGNNQAVTSANGSVPINHTYATAGTYNISISGGTCTYFGSTSSNLISVSSFGTYALTTINFSGCSKLVQVPTTLPSTVTNLGNTFSWCTSFNQDISTWDVSNVTNMNGMFSFATSFNQNLLSWNVSNVTNMNDMFSGATSFNGDISSWVPSSVTNFSRMFKGATAFNKNLNNWNVTAGTSFTEMFYGCTSFNQTLDNWVVKGDLGSMFYGCTSFNQSLNSWDVSGVTNFMYTFYGCTNFNGDITSWVPSSAVWFNYAFAGCTSFNQAIGNWDMSSATNLSYMFSNCNSFNQPLDNWNVSNVTTMEFMFGGALIFNQDLNSWDVSKVLSMRSMFAAAKAFNGNISSWVTSSVTNFFRMFQDANAFNRDISGWNTSSATNFGDLFQNAFAFNQDISAWNVSNVTSFGNTFSGASAFNQDLSNWDYSKVTYIDNMFLNSALSPENYSAVLNRWNSQSISNMDINMGAIQYTCAGKAAHDNLDNNLGWTFYDWGLVPLTANAGIDNTIPGLNYQLSGNDPSLQNATGEWTSVGGTFDNASLYNATLTANDYGNVTATWTVSVAGCTSATDDVVINFTNIDNPTDFVATPVSATEIDLTWVENTAGNDFIMAYNTTNTFGVPVNGTSYNLGDPIVGGGTILLNDGSMSYSHTVLNPNTTYYYKVWSKDTYTYYSTGIETSATTFDLPINPLGNSLNFDGVDDYVNLNNTSSNFGTNNFTVEFWFKTTQTDGVLISKRSECTANTFWNITMESDGTMAVETYAPDLVFFEKTSVPVNDNEWHHFAWIRDGITNTYVLDGILDKTFTTAADVDYTNNANIFLASSPCAILTIEPFFNGSMDELRIWDAARTVTEIHDNFETYIKILFGNPKPVAYYRFDQGGAGVDNSMLDTQLIDYAGCSKGDLVNFAMDGTTSNWVFSGTDLLPIIGTISATPTATDVDVTANIFSIGSSDVLKVVAEVYSDECMTNLVSYKDILATYGTGEFTLTVSGLTPETSYYVRAYGENSEWGTYGESLSFTTLAATAIEDNHTNLNIYPNPTSGIVSLNFAQISNIKNIEISDITGKIVYSNTKAGKLSDYSIDLSNQNSGLYFIKIQTETGMYFEKIIKQ